MDDKELHKDNCGCGDDCGCDGNGHGEDGCGCGCEDHDHGGLFVTLVDEKGEEVSCEVIEGFEYKDNEYALVQNPNDGSIYLFKVVGEGDEGQLEVPEDEEFNEAIAYYESIIGSEQQDQQ